ncbi:hypothetical protein Tco_0743117 [Tanacetum coccineum]
MTQKPIRVDEEVLRQTLEEQARAEKEWEDRIKKEEVELSHAHICWNLESFDDVSSSNLHNEEPEEDDEDPEEDLADYPADGDDDDDEDEDEDDEEEEEHPAPADSVLPVHCMTARISIQDEPSISLPPREEVHSDEIAPTTVEEVNQRVTDLATIVEEETTSMRVHHRLASNDKRERLRVIDFQSYSQQIKETKGDFKSCWHLTTRDVQWTKTLRL